MKILVIQQKMIGDVLTSSIIFPALRKLYPKAELHYLIYPHTWAVVQNNPNIDKLVFFDPKKNNTALGLWRFSGQLRNEGYDLIIDVYAKISTAILSKLSRAKQRISYHKWYTSWAYTHTLDRKAEPGSSAALAIEHRLALLKPLDSNYQEVLKPSIHLKAEEISAARAQLKKMGIDTSRPLVMANILGSSPAKTYPLAYMAKVLDLIAQEFNPQILLNYMPAQKKQMEQVYKLCLENTKKHLRVDLCGANLREFLAITYHCDALVGNEGGAINMAKALGIPTFAIFSPQIDKKTWSIFEDDHTKVSVHLTDFKPEILKGKSTGEITKNSQVFYREFKPQYIFPKLKEFLQANI